MTFRLRATEHRGSRASTAPGFGHLAALIADLEARLGAIGACSCSPVHYWPLGPADEHEHSCAVCSTYGGYISLGGNLHGRLSA